MYVIADIKISSAFNYKSTNNNDNKFHEIVTTTQNWKSCEKSIKK